MPDDKLEALVQEKLRDSENYLKLLDKISNAERSIASIQEALRLTNEDLVRLNREKRKLETRLKRHRDFKRKSSSLIAKETQRTREIVRKQMVRYARNKLKLCL